MQKISDQKWDRCRFQKDEILSRTRFCFFPLSFGDHHQLGLRNVVTSNSSILVKVDILPKVHILNVIFPPTSTLKMISNCNHVYTS